MDFKDELQSIISRIGQNSTRDLIEAAAHHLGKSKEASGITQTIQLTKSQEATWLIDWINQSGIWFNQIDENRFIARGAEQRVYLDEDTRYVIKLNDSIFYEYWLDYFHSLLIHNFLFPQTAYKLIGFYIDNTVLHAVVKQPFIEITEPTNTMLIREFLFANGFQLKKNNDYYHEEAGVVLEDLHDENVLTNNGTLFFIDTAFYLSPSFFKNSKRTKQK
jgi:Serine/Threonine/Tyrosine Kinase found in polyvalent proteins